MEKVYSISELSQMFGITSRTLRYYGDAGLIRSESRSSGDVRHFNEENAERLKIILTLRDAGLSLESIRQYLQGECTLADILAKHEKELDAQMNHILEQHRKVRVLMEKAQTQTDIKWGEEPGKEAGEREENRQLARMCIEEFLHDKFDLFFENASQLLKNVTSYEVFGNVWRDTLDGLGECLAVEEQILELPGILFLLRFAELDVGVRFVFGENEIQGFWLEYRENGVSKGLRLRC